MQFESHCTNLWSKRFVSPVKPLLVGIKWSRNWKSHSVVLFETVLGSQREHETAKDATCKYREPYSLQSCCVRQHRFLNDSCCDLRSGFLA